MRAPDSSTTIAIVLYDGFEELDAFGPYEVLNTAAAQGADLSVELRTVDRRERVTANYGLEVEPDGVLDDDVDIVIVPGGGWSDRADEGAWAEAQRGNLPDALVSHHRNGGLVAGVCSGGMIVASAGLLEGRPAITHQAAVDELHEYAGEVIDARVVDDGDVVTAGGVTAGLDLGLVLVERLAGAELANTVATILEYDRRTDIHRS